jgi:[acyl-carrier-protein] S-malonyltransferase
LIKNASVEYAELLSDTIIQGPDITVIHNEDVSEATTPDEIKLRLTRQLYRPVRWVETMQAIVNLGVMRGAECGPGKVLSGLSKRIDRSFDMSSLASAESMDSCITEYQGAQS